MELIILIIKMIAKAFDSPGTRSPGAPSDAARQMDLARQIQQRIEEARARAAQEQQGRRGQQDSSGPMMARLPPPIQRPMNPQKAMRKQTGRQPTPQRAVGAVKRKVKRSAPPPLPSQAAMAAAPAMASLTAAEVSARAPAAVRRPPIPSADAKLLSRWLRPQTLRSQFILTEIFQPPLALRQQPPF